MAQATPDWTQAFGNLATTLPGYFLSNNQANNGYNAAVGASGYNPTGINGPIGSVGSNGAGGYNLSASPAFAPFGALGTAAGNYGLSTLAGPNQYDTSANSVMSAFKNFDPNAFANNEYGQLSSMAAPGVTDQIQGLENFEQGSGRGGITQNGQLGDIGGLDLALRTADTGRRLQAMTDARNQGGYLANLATTFQNQGNTQRAQGMNIATGGLNNTLAINGSLQSMLQDAISNSSNRALAGYRQGSYSVGKGNSQADTTGRLFNNMGQALFNNGSNPFSAISNWWSGGNNGTPPSTDPNSSDWQDVANSPQFANGAWGNFGSTDPSQFTNANGFEDLSGNPT